MKKLKLILIALAIGVVVCAYNNAYSAEKPSQYSISGYEPEFGITVDGYVFIKESLADKYEDLGDTIEVNGNFNEEGWDEDNWLSMILIDKDHNLATKDDGYYVYKITDATILKQIEKKFQKGKRMLWCIRLSDNVYFPTCGTTATVKYPFDDKDLKANKPKNQLKKGEKLSYNFNTLITDQISFK